jgi:hypothetical protein
MDLLLLVLMLESVLASLSEVQPDGVLALSGEFQAESAMASPDEVEAETILPLHNRSHTSYTLTASCSRSCTGRFVQFTGTGYVPPANLGNYQVCVKNTSLPGSQCHSIGFVSSDGVVRFSQQISSETFSVCIVLFQSLSVATRRVPSSESGMGVPLSIWPERHQKLACVRFEDW